MKHTLQHIQYEFNSKKRLKFIFFWGHQPAKDGSVTKSCFSQWWEDGFTVKNETFKTAEHWMMAEKARIFNDEEKRNKVLTVNHPHEAKQLGRKVKNFDPVIWDEHKFNVVVEGNHHKFSQHEHLQQFLLNTKNRVLVEASPRDKIWGIGMSENDEHITNPNLWKGQNLLGFALMEVRDQLKKDAGIKSQEPRAKSQEPRAKSQEPRAKSQEPRAKSQDKKFVNSW
ncbi:N-glycosidase YbiA [Kordia sp. SMS9]|uniref:NADAR family protein n=1 Tax=Kordia sp. SMS9 TaxID=2282170 RepID=UPI000E0DBF92|nr:N-glycosidase YbiA [Kordia sp. SMS9]